MKALARWEFMFVETNVFRSPGIAMVDRYGRAGWELVAVVHTGGEVDRLYFKRRIPGKVVRKRASA